MEISNKIISLTSSLGADMAKQLETLFVQQYQAKFIEYSVGPHQL